MYPFQLPNAASSVVSVITSAASLQSLLNTAAGSTIAFPTGLDSVDLIIENGDVRLLYDGNTPTNTAGVLLKQGTIHRFRGVPFTTFKLISVTGTVSVGVTLGFTAPYDLASSSAGSASSSGSIGTTTTPNVSTIADPTTPTTRANVISPGTGQNSLLTAGSYQELLFTTTTAQAVASTDVSNYKWISVQITSQGTSSVVNFQCSNDNLNWVSVALWDAGNGGNGNSTNSNATKIFSGPLQFRYFRLNVTGISAGTTAGVIELYSLPAYLVPGTYASSQNGTWTVQPGNTANTTAWLETLRPSTSGGLTIYRLLSAATTNGNNIKGSTGQLYSYYLYNNTASAKFVKLYNKATSPTVGTDTPVMTLPVAANTGAFFNSDIGITFATGLGIAITGAIGDSDTTAVAVNDVTVNLLYS